MPMWSVEVVWMLAVVSTNHCHAIQMQHTLLAQFFECSSQVAPASTACSMVVYFRQWFFMHFSGLMDPCDLSTVLFHAEYWEKNWTYVTATYHFNPFWSQKCGIPSNWSRVRSHRRDSQCVSHPGRYNSHVGVSQSWGQPRGCPWDGWAWPRTDAESWFCNSLFFHIFN